MPEVAALLHALSLLVRLWNCVLPEPRTHAATQFAATASEDRFASLLCYRVLLLQSRLMGILYDARLMGVL